MAVEQENSQVDELESSPVESDASGSASAEGAAAEAAVAEKMNEVFRGSEAKQQADEIEEEGLTSPDNPDGDTPENDEPDEPKDEEQETSEATGDEATAEQAAQAERKSVLDAFDPNLKKVAQQLGGWNTKDLEDFIVSNPALARATFSNMAAGYNNLSLQYARGVRPVHPGLAQQPQPVATPQSSPLDELLANPAKLAALQEIAGEELTKLFIKPLLEERKSMVEDRAFMGTLKRDALVREINDSFSSLNKTGFDSFYGKNGEVTQEQNSNRFKVGQLADQIRAGAQMQGIAMSVDEAINRAHLVITANQTKEQARKEIVQQVKKRSTQITARPTGRKSRPTATRGEDAALAAVESFWDSR